MIPSPELICRARSPLGLPTRQVVILLPDLPEQLYACDILQSSRCLGLLQSMQQMHSICPDLLRQCRALVFCFWQAIILDLVAVAIKPVGADLPDEPIRS